MQDVRLGVIETRFADIIWANAPMKTNDLVEICEKELGWARTTTYTVLKKLCNRGVFDMRKAHTRVLIPREEFYAIRTEQFVDSNFGGSLPAFVAAFTSRRTPSKEELDEIRKLIDSI